MLVLKILFNTLFIAYFQWGIIGAVMATLVSNILISVWMYYELFIKDGEDKLILSNFRFDFKILHHLIKLGLPCYVLSLMLNLGFLLINNEIEKYETHCFKCSRNCRKYYICMFQFTISLWSCCHYNGQYERWSGTR